MSTTSRQSELGAKMPSSFRCFLGALLIIAMSSASATVVTWRLDGVTFDDGRQATGFFTLDDTAPGFLQALEISTTAGGAFPAGAYTLASLVIPITDVVRLNQVQITSPGGHLAMTFSTAILDCAPVCGVAPASVGTVNPIDAAGPQNYEYLYNTTQALRTITGGSIVAVPEPASWALFSLGLAAVLWAWRSRVTRVQRYANA